MNVTSLWLLIPLLAVYLPLAMQLSAVDAREQRLPNRLVGQLSALTTLGVLLTALVVPAARAGLPFAVLSALVLGLGAVAAALISPVLLGMGDAKTLPVVVLIAGALHPLVLIGALLAIVIVGAVVGIVVLFARGASARFAFGPVLLSAPFLGLLLQPLLVAALAPS